MKILFILSQFYPLEGGAERQALLLARYLSKKGANIDIITGRWKRKLPRREMIQGVQIFRNFTLGQSWNSALMRYFSGFVYMISLAWFLLVRGPRYEVFHVHQAFYPAFISALLSRILEKPLMIKVGGGGEGNNDLRLMKSGRYPFGKWMLKTILKADRFIAISSQIEKELIDLGIPEGKIVPIPNGVEIPEAWKQDYKLNKPGRVVFAGRLNPEKRCDLLIQAILKIINETSIHCDIFGDGPLKQPLGEEIDRLGLGSAIRLKGHREDLQDSLPEYDVFVLPSGAEGMSNALLEAMARGLPCVVSGIPPNRDLVDPEHECGDPGEGEFQVGRCGLFFRPGDSKGLAEALQYLCDDEEVRRNIGVNARARIAGDFSIEGVAERYLALYRQTQEKYENLGA